MKTVEINGRYFEVIRSRKYVNAIHYNYTGNDLSKFYAKPSKAKQDIYNEWHKWWCETDEVEMMQVRGGNGFTFTLEGLWKKGKAIIGYIEITKEHNRIYIPERGF